MGVRFGIVALASAAALGASAAASAQVPDLPVTPTVPALPGLPDLLDVPVVPDVSDVPTVPGVTGTQSGGSSGGSSGSSSRSGSAAWRARAGSGSNATHTRFDRLPRRFERLLERLLAGRDVDANLRRLDQLLASASPRLRARILRLVRREIRALEQGRTTPEERRRIKRLHRVEDLFAPPAEATATTAATPVSAAALPPGDDGAGDTSGSPSGVASAAGTSEPQKGPEPFASPDSGILGLPSTVDGIRFGTSVLVLGAVLLAFAAVAFALAALPTRAVPVGVRQRVKRSRSNLAALGLAALAATMLLLFVVALS